MRQKRPDLAFYIKGVNPFLYLLLAAFLIADTLIFNTPMLRFFLLSLLIVPAISLYQRYIKWAFVVAFVFILIGSIGYLTSAPYNLQAMGNRLVAVGYCIFVDCLIALAVYTVIQKYALGQKAGEIRQFVQSNSAVLSYALFSVVIIDCF